MKGLTQARSEAFFRSFTIQGSWNYRTMIGSGFGFAILPVLRLLFRDDEEGYRAALQRHAEHFNAHPYLAGLALGAVCKMEESGRSAEEVRRFKTAVRGPLGSLGDTLIWVGWRPAVVLLAILLALAGVPPGLTVILFLVVYNLGHLALRVWGFRVGLEHGSQVGDSLRFLALPRQADRIAASGVFLLGGMAGMAGGIALEQGWWGVLWVCLAGAGLWIGSVLAQRSWRWSLWGMSLVVVALFIFGWFG